MNQKNPFKWRRYGKEIIRLKALVSSVTKGKIGKQIEFVNGLFKVAA